MLLVGERINGSLKSVVYKKSKKSKEMLSISIFTSL